jgi:hypothetical protein
MRMNNVGFVFVMSGCVAVASLIGCGSSTLPGMGSPLPLTAVDGKPLPVVIASTTSDQTLVTGGNAVLGEAIATGSYTLSLRHATGTTSQTSDISGTTNFAANGSKVTATIDLGVALGQHVYTFGL